MAITLCLAMLFANIKIFPLHGTKRNINFLDHHSYLIRVMNFPSAYQPQITSNYADMLEKLLLIQIQSTVNSCRHPIFEGTQVCTCSDKSSCSSIICSASECLSNLQISIHRMLVRTYNDLHLVKCFSLLEN